MAQSERKKLRKQFSARAGYALTLALVTAIVTLLVGTSKYLNLTELISLDFRYRNRPAPEFRDDLGYIDIDDESIAHFGTWTPWPRNRQVALVRTLDHYDARAVGYDVFFTERENTVFKPEPITRIMDKFGNDTAAVTDEIKQELEDRIWDSFLSYDGQFSVALANAGNVFLAEILLQPPAVPADSEPFEFITEQTEKNKGRFSEEKARAVELAKGFGIPADTVIREALYKAVDIYAVLPELAEASAGVGYAQIVKDFDPTVRLYPFFMYYDEVAMPSIGAVMLSDLLDVPMDSFLIYPGDRIEIANASLPPLLTSREENSPRDQHRTINIPIDDNGQMLVNWGGVFYGAGLHISYRVVAIHYAWILAKEEARTWPTDIESFAPLSARIENILLTDEWVTEEEAQTIAEKVALAHIITPLLENETIEEARRTTAELLPGSENELFGELAAAVAHLHDRPAPQQISRFRKEEIAKYLDFFRERGRLDEAYPLAMPPSSDIPWGSYRKSFSPIDFADRIFMVGLTGVGTHDINPMPYEKAYPMVGLHLNALNTVLTEQFLQRPPKGAAIIGVGVLALLAGLLCAFLRPAGAFVACSALGVVYSGLVYAMWIVQGLWLPWVLPLCAVALCLLISIFLEFIKAARERQKIRGIFSTMVSPKVLKLMEDDPDRFSLSGERKAATMFFSMIGGFSKVTSGVAPDELSSILSLYLTPTSEIIMDYDGYIDKYEGHIIMADFGVPLDDPGHAWKCAFAAVEQQQDIRAFKRFVEARYGEEVTVYQGMNSGYVSAGNMGSEQKMQYTVMGDAVNVAARFMPANFIYHTGTITGEDSEPLIRDEVELRELDRLLLKGKTKPTTIYEIVGWKPTAYLSLRGHGPVPDALLVRWSKCPPEKIFAYAEFFTERAETFDEPLARDLGLFFESQFEVAEELMCLDAMAYIGSLERQIRGLIAIAAEIAEKPELSTLLTSANSSDWREQLQLWIDSLTTVRSEFEALAAKGKKLADEHTSLREMEFRAENLSFKAEKLLENLAKKSRVGWSAVENTLEAIRRTLAGEAPPADAGKKLQEARKRYRTAVTKRFKQLSSDPKGYHTMMSVIGSITQNQKELRELYIQGLRLHRERKWDESISVWKQALAIDPNDSPTQIMIERVEDYRNNPPGPEWQGEFVQTKK